MHTCWNCGADHSLKDRPDPFNQATIDKNKRIFFKNKRTNGSGTDGSRGPDTQCKTGGYTLPNFGKDTASGSTHGVIGGSNGQVYTSCKHDTATNDCGMNQTHLSKYHAQWKANKSKSKLPSTHPFKLHSSTPDDNCVDDFNDGSNATNAAVQTALKNFKADIHKKLANIETQSESPDLSNAVRVRIQLFQ